MSLSIIARKIEEPPEEGGSDEGGDCEGWTCEQCGSADFRLPVWRGAPMIVCIDCSQPQDAAIWVAIGDD